MLLSTLVLRRFNPVGLQQTSTCAKQQTINKHSWQNTSNIHVCLRLIKLEHGKLLIAGLAVGLIVSLQLGSPRDGVIAVRALKAELVVGLTVEYQQLGGVHSLTTAGIGALLDSRAEGLLNGLGSLADYTGSLLVLLTLIAILLVVHGLVGASAIELLVALRAQRLVVMIAVITSANDAVAVHALEAEFVVDLTKGSETLSEHDALLASGADGIVAGGVNHNHLLLSLTVVGDLSSHEVGALKIVESSSISSDRENAHAHLLEVLELEQIAHAEQIHLRATNASREANEATHVLSLEEGRALSNLRIRHTTNNIVLS